MNQHHLRLRMAAITGSSTMQRHALPDHTVGEFDGYFMIGERMIISDHTEQELAQCRTAPLAIAQCLGQVLVSLFRGHFEAFVELAASRKNVEVRIHGFHALRKKFGHVRMIRRRTLVIRYA